MVQKVYGFSFFYVTSFVGFFLFFADYAFHWFDMFPSLGEAGDGNA